jgi:O-antigen ligase
VLQEPYVAALALPSWIPVDQRSVPWTHNLYLETLAEQGIVGLAALVVLLAAALRSARYAAARAPGAEARTLAAGALGGLVAIAVAGLVELSFVREWVVVATFALLGVTSHHSALRAHDQEEPS